MMAKAEVLDRKSHQLGRLPFKHVFCCFDTFFTRHFVGRAHRKAQGNPATEATPNPNHVRCSRRVIFCSC
jgi:hypothetical protein